MARNDPDNIINFFFRCYLCHSYTLVLIARYLEPRNIRVLKLRGISNRATISTYCCAVASFRATKIYAVRKGSNMELSLTNTLIYVLIKLVNYLN